MVHNNTIVDNTNEGITFTGSNTPDVRNNILYFNNADAVTSVQTAGVGTTYYCCIYDPNNAPTSVPDSDGNITCEPDFVYDSEPYGYYHIKYESDCRNGGDNTCVGQDETDMDDEPRIADDAYDIVDVGADEVDCEDTYDPNDWTYDGVINLEEFAIFAVAWAGHDLNDPVCDPNHLDYVSDPNDPDYISAEQKEAWDPYFNFDAAGDSEYAIDVADLAVFLDNWLWEACWHVNYSEVMYAMSGGGESMVMAVPVSISTPATLQPQPVEEKSIAEQIFDLEDCIEFLETMWLEDAYFQQEIDSDGWEEFMDAAYEDLSDLEKILKRQNKKK